MIGFTDVLITVAALLLLAVPGYIFAKAKMLKSGASEVLSIIALYGCQPVLIIVSFQKCAFDAKIALNMLIVAFLSAAMHILFFVILKIAFLKCPLKEKIGIVKYVSVFSNCGFMGIPFLQSLFSDSGMKDEILIYCAVIIAIFQVLNWTVGVYIITGEKKEVSLKKTVLNPVMISVALGLILFLAIGRPLTSLLPSETFGGKVLSKLMSSLEFISNMVTPLSMIIIGIRLANVNFKQLFMDKWAYIATAIKLIVMPIVTIFVVSYLPIASTVKYTVFFLLAMPSATSGVMMAVKFGKDGDFASVCVLLSTLLSVITLPPLYLFMNGVLKIPL